MRLVKSLITVTLIGLLYGCGKNESQNPIKNAENQFSALLEQAEKANKIPRTLDEKGEIIWANTDFDWTEGFFPGSCWYLYEATKDSKWKQAAEHFQTLFENHKKRTDNHDLGFVFNCSYGNDYRLTNNENSKKVMIEATNSLITRFAKDIKN